MRCETHRNDTRGGGCGAHAHAGQRTARSQVHKLLAARWTVGWHRHVPLFTFYFRPLEPRLLLAPRVAARIGAAFARTYIQHTHTHTFTCAHVLSYARLAYRRINWRRVSALSTAAAAMRMRLHWPQTQFTADSNGNETCVVVNAIPVAGHLGIMTNISITQFLPYKCRTPPYAKRQCRLRCQLSCGRRHIN